MEKAGIFFPQAHLDPRQMAELAAAGHEILGFDAIMPEFSVQQEAAALGCEIDWGSPSMMPDAKTHPFQRLEDLKIPENILEKPSLKIVLEALNILRRRHGDEVAIIGKVMGPWTISYHMAGTENFLLWFPGCPERGNGPFRQGPVPGRGRRGGACGPCHRGPGEPQDLPEFSPPGP
jgi:[methyl-Co(III) methanol-specific corrinoid protein]:coenzyme M methyltransferase